MSYSQKSFFRRHGPPSGLHLFSHCCGGAALRPPGPPAWVPGPRLRPLLSRGRCRWVPQVAHEPRTHSSRFRAGTPCPGRRFKSCVYFLQILLSSLKRSRAGPAVPRRFQRARPAADRAPLCVCVVWVTVLGPSVRPSTAAAGGAGGPRGDTADAASRRPSQLEQEDGDRGVSAGSTGALRVGSACFCPGPGLQGGRVVPAAPLPRPAGWDARACGARGQRGGSACTGLGCSPGKCPDVGPCLSDFSLSCVSVC